MICYVGIQRSNHNGLESYSGAGWDAYRDILLELDTKGPSISHGSLPFYHHFLLHSRLGCSTMPETYYRLSVSTR